MKIKVYDLLRDAVENGAAMGVRRAYKHTENPSQDAIIASVENEVMLAIGNIFDFSDEKVGGEW